MARCRPAPCPDVDTARRICARWTSLADDVLGVWAVDAPGVALPADAPRPSGSVLLLTLPRSDGAGSSTVEIGWHLHPSAWGHGIATEGALALVERARAGGSPGCTPWSARGTRGRLPSATVSA